MERKREHVESLLAEKKMRELKEYLANMTPVDVAEIIGPLDDATSLILFRILHKDVAAEVFAKLDKDAQVSMISVLEDKEAQDIIEELYFDDIIDLLEEVPANITEKILYYTTKEERSLVNQFLNYGPDTAGGLMTIEYIDVRRDMTVRQALDHIKEVGLDTQLIYTVYVLDDKRKLCGYLGLRQLVTADEDLLIDDLINTDIVKVTTDTGQEQVAQVFTRYGFVALPVVDKEGRMVGVITVDDVFDIITKETTEDFQRLAGTSPTEEDYMSESTWDMVKNRLPWLLFLMISATFTGRIMGYYEGLLAENAVLALFIPMLMDTGGNSGSQSSTLVTRGLAVGDIKSGDGLKVILKEFRVGIIAGVILSAVNFVRLYFLEGIPAAISLGVSITLIATLVMSKVIGGVLPLIAERFNMDPATMAGPLITTIVDAMTLWIYFQIVSSFIGL